MNTYRLDQNGHLFTEDEGEVTAGELSGRVITSLSSARRCHMCGQWIDPAVKGDTVVAHPDPCLYPEGITSVVELAVPSGFMVVTDDLRPLYNGFTDDRVDYNTALGQVQVIREYARQGCAYGPVGNSCPGFYRTGDDTYIIASPMMYDEDGEEIDPEPPDRDRLAHITTDLWAYSIADRDDFAAKGGELRPHQDEVVQVRPGVYRFTHHSTEKAFDPDAEGVVTFAHVEWVGEVGQRGK